MSHLGRWLSALVDGELDGDERDRVLNHLARCRPCLEEANEMRAIKRRLTALGGAWDDTAITDRLIDLAHSDHEDLAGGPASRLSWPTSKTGSDSRYGSQILQARRLRNWRTATGTAGTALVVIGLAAFMLGSSQAGGPAPRITPSVDAYWLQHSFDSGQEPATTPGPAAQATPESPGPRGRGLGRAGPAPAPAIPVSQAPATGRPGTPASTPTPRPVTTAPASGAPRRSSG